MGNCPTCCSRRSSGSKACHSPWGRSHGFAGPGIRTYVRHRDHDSTATPTARRPVEGPWPPTPQIGHGLPHQARDPLVPALPGAVAVGPPDLVLVRVGVEHEGADVTATPSVAGVGPLDDSTSPADGHGQRAAADLTAGAPLDDPVDGRPVRRRHEGERRVQQVVGVEAHAVPPVELGDAVDHDEELAEPGPVPVVFVRLVAHGRARPADVRRSNAVTRHHELELVHRRDDARSRFGPRRKSDGPAPP